MTKPVMDRQDVFDTVAEHLIQQGKAAVYPNKPDGFEYCRYRTPDGTMCAVGCLIPDSAYKLSIENKTAKSVAVEEALPFLVASVADSDFLHDLQLAHDCKLRHGGLLVWYEEMLQVAADFDLDTTFIQKRFAEKRASEDIN